jgi:hypothetical protein
MSKLLLPSTLLLFVFYAGCASSPKIVGKWKIQPSNQTENMEAAQVFPDGTVLITGTEEDSPFLMSWSMIEGQFVITAPDEAPVKVLLPDRNVMIWKQQKNNGDVIVLHRISN